MRIAIDSRFLRPPLEGFGRFTKEVVSRLLQAHPAVEWDLLFDRKPLPGYDLSGREHAFVLPPPTRHWSLYEVWWRFSVPLYFLSRRPNAIFATYGLVSRAAARCTPTVAFIHDVAFARHPEFLPRDWSWYYKSAFRRTVQAAHLLLANSISVQEDLIELFQAPPNKIRVAYNGCDIDFFHPLPHLDVSSVRQRYAKGYPYLLYVGSLHPRKNIMRLLMAYDLLRQRYHLPLRLLLVGRFLFRRGEMLSAYESMRYKSEVIFHKPVPDEELRLLYNAAEVVVYPSLYEGFGYPVVEALACGAPVVTSSCSSLPEVGGEAAFYANPFDPSSLAEVMEAALLQSKEERQRRAQAGRLHVQRFRWDNVVATIWTALKEIAT
ncbi:MAG: glycosyltransferase family 1 protein [Bacteroidia bacterium]|nr:glycosyltransferase family 4 protein [Bacteroidia bacterium]MDW8014722.1 glycosyltransferase family 1 protein [Bacteroidia bacterium]